MALTPAKASRPKDTEDASEGITVAIRMRPLNNMEDNQGRIWKVLPKYSSVAQTTRDGKPLSERVTGRTFFTFDKTFGEDTNNQQVYDTVAKGIVGSVVQGLNGTIFAYGQTSSGKTYTMQGSGNLEQGSSGNSEGGLVHMAARDIFSQIVSQPNRMFLVRVSFLEIYNEEVRDLLADSNQKVQIREDPRRGVFVQSEEEIVTDFESLLGILIRGDKSRTFAATGMNERSSRSHTILRITIESREKESNENEDDSNRDSVSGSTDGAVRVSTLNLVDLAGSESVRHTGATGERQKEGGLINQSLLTLSRVIVALGTPNQMHINFRDSKLTRILQPSLSGNARMAVICCATPSELYLEETRSTLQFASRAKLVKTNAQVNEVLDERSMIRRLQRELAEAKRNQTGADDQQVRDLEKQVENAGTQALEAKEKLDRLKSSILNAGYLFDQAGSSMTDSLSLEPTRASKKRRKSEGPLLIGRNSPSKDTMHQLPTPKTAPRQKKTQTLYRPTLPAEKELELVQQALASRNQFVRELNTTINRYSEQVKEKNDEVERVMAEKSSLDQEKSEVHAEVEKLREVISSMQTSLESTVQENEKRTLEKEAELVNAFERLQQSLGQRSSLEEQLSSIQTRFEEVKEERVRGAFEVAQMTTEKENLLAERSSDKLKLQEMAGKTEFLTTNLNEATEERDEALTEIEKLRRQIESNRLESEELQKSQNNKIADLEGKLEAIHFENGRVCDENNTLQSQLSGANDEIESLTEQMSSLEKTLQEQSEQRVSIESKMAETTSELETMCAAKQVSEDSIANLTSQLKESDDALQMERAQNDKKASEVSNMTERVESLLAEKEELHHTCERLQAEKKSSLDRLHVLSDEKDVVVAEKNSVEAIVTTYQQSITEMEESLAAAAGHISRLQKEKDTAMAASFQSLEKIQKYSNDLKLEKDRSAQLEKTKTDLDVLCEERLDTIGAMNVASKDLQENLDSLRQERDSLTESLGKLEAGLSNLQSESTERDQATEEIKTANEVLASQVQTLSNDIDIRDKEIETLTANHLQSTLEAKDLTSHRGELQLKVDALVSKNAELSEKILSLEMDLETSNETETIISSLRDENEAASEEIVGLQDQVDAVLAVAKTFQDQCAELEDSNNCAQEELNKTQSKVDETLQELNEVVSSREALVKNLRDCESQRDAVTAEVQDLFEKNRQLKESLSSSLPKEKEALLRTEVSHTKSENVELQQLLASVNESEERLRIRVTGLEEDLKRNIKDLDEAKLRVTQLEEEISHAELAKLNQSQMEESQHDLGHRIYALENEKQELERKLSEETQTWRNRETEMQKQMREEQRVLIQEGEGVMSDLRNKLQACEGRLSQAESEAYTARQQVEEISDERKNLEQSYLEASGQVETLEGANGKLKFQISKLNSELGTAKSECYSLKESFIDMKDKMRKSTRESEKAIRDCERANNELTTVRKKLSSLEGRIDADQAETAKLQKTFQEMEKARKQIDYLKNDLATKDSLVDKLKKEMSDLQLEKASAMDEIKQLTASSAKIPSGSAGNKENNEGVAKLQHKVNELKDEMRKKDQRIKKLEAVRITKELLKKIKETETKKERLEKQCATLQKENSLLTSQGPSGEAESEMRTELSSLRMDKEVLEKKVRKFASHCQRLEDDKAGMKDALRSCNVDIEEYDGDIGEAVIHLCDKLTSSEEARAMKKNDDRLQDENASLRHEVEKLTGKLESYRLHLEDVKRAAKKHSADGKVLAEHEERIKEFESENLQLMQDLKLTKKQLQSTRAELESARMNFNIAEPTIDFAAMGSRPSSSSTSRSTRSTRSSTRRTAAKEEVIESSDTMDLMDLSRMVAGNQAPPSSSRKMASGAKKQSTKKKRPALSESTNRSAPKDVTRDSSTATKRQRREEVTKSSRAERATRRTPGLGESSSLEGSETTSECNQS